MNSSRELISAVYQKENFLSRRQRADVLNSTLDESKKTKMLHNLSFPENQQINIMITGATGVRKSSTINALFDANVANVGTGVDPETMDIKWYKLKNLILWDTPGLGDGAEADARHAKNIVKKLNELDANGNPLIDLVLVLLEGGSRDLGTSYDLINNVIIPNLGGKTDRILIAINQADVAMKGRHWDDVNNRPDFTLEKFLREQAQSVKRRVREATGVNIPTPIYY